MDKAVIFQVFDFVSFHICKSLLNKGYDVTGVHLLNTEEKSELDEKRLEVGRNANFSEIALSQWDTRIGRNTDTQVLILSIYDLYMLKKDSILQEEQSLMDMLKGIENHPSMVDLVVLLPMQLLRKDDIQGFTDFLRQINKLKNQTQFIYLPAIFGPWQPEAFLFHQKIISSIKGTILSISEREWTDDAIYVEDAVESIIGLIESEKRGSYLLESGQKDYWEACAHYLNIDLSKNIKKSTSTLEIDSQIRRIPVKTISPMAESVEKQIEHTERLYRRQL